MSASDSVYELRNVTYRYAQQTAINDVSLRIGAGERIALIGPSGAGKSTLFKLLNGSVTPTTGTVTVFGADLAQTASRQRRRIQRQIGTIYQQLHLVGALQVIHNVNAGQLGDWSLAKAVLSLFWPLDSARVEAILADLGIADKLYLRTDQLSGGEQQRVALARVLLQNPAVILADEPVASIDPERSRSLMDILRRLSLSAQTTLVTSLHTLEFAYSHFERTIGLRHGQIAFDCQTKAVTAPMIETLYAVDEADHE